MEQEKMVTGPGYRIRNQKEIYFLTFRVVYWIDVFSRQRYRDIFMDSLRYCRKEKGLNVHAYVIMTNHVHLILSVKEGKLSDIIRDMKSYTSKKIVNSITQDIESRRDWMLGLLRFSGRKNFKNKNHQFWHQNNHPVELNDNEIMDQKLNYIHANPVKAGWVYKAEDYIYSSAANYAGESGLIDIDFL